jgi:hypothetical protein
MDWIEEFAENTKTQEEIQESISYGTALAEIVSMSSVLKGLGELDDDIKWVMLRRFDQWLDAISPVIYSPGLAEVLGDKIKNGFEAIFNEMTEEEFAEFLDRLIELKESGNVSLNDVKEVFFWTAKLLNSLGVDIAELSEFVDLSDPRTALSNLTALTAITLAITLSRG